MPEPFACPHCGAETGVSEEPMGTSGPCAHCGAMVTIPAAARASAAGQRTDRLHRVTPFGLVVLAALAILVVYGAVFLARSVVRTHQHVNGRKHHSTERSIGLFADELELYKLSCVGYPTTAQGLEALRACPFDVDQSVWDGPYHHGPIPLDPWGNPYQYESPGKRNPDSYDLWSLGPDGTDGTEDDIGNWRDRDP